MKIQYYIFIFFCYFPFITPYNFGSDIQPYALLLALTIVVPNVLFDLKLNKRLFPIALVAIFSSIMLIIGGRPTFLGIRSAINYISLFFIASASLIAFKRFEGLNEKYFKITINMWFVIGAIQLIYDRSFLNFLIAGARTSSSRGVISLASEPSFYGYTIVFMMLFVLDFKKDRFVYLINLLVQLFLFSQSAVAILYLFIYVGIYLLSNIIKINFKQYKAIIAIVTFVALTTLLAFKIYPDNRATIIMKEFMANPMQLVQRDKSISVRVESILNPLKVSFSHLLVPHGYYNTFEHTGYSRIMSGYGAALYELGVVGLFLIVKVHLIIKKAIYHTNSKINAIFITIIMFSAIQIASPIFAFYIGYCIYKSDHIPNELFSYNAK